MKFVLSIYYREGVFLLNAMVRWRSLRAVV